MASDKLQKILEMSKNMDKNGSKVKQAQPGRAINTPRTLNEEIRKADKTIANIDAMYNSPYVPTQEEKEAWNTERGREELTEMADQGTFMKKLSQSKLPSAIIESMRKNPCNYDTRLVDKVMGPENELFKKLNEAYGKEKEEPVRGVKALQQINEQLDKRDNEKASDTQIRENYHQGISNEGYIDLSVLEQIMERVIDKKLGTLNESAQRTSSSIKTMRLTENGTFRFVDTEGNVYECQMKYLGKRKKNHK